MKKNKKSNPVNNDVQESNLVKKITLEGLYKRHNALARYIGIPCIVPATEVYNGAVMADGTVMHSKNYACYRVDLSPFNGEFDRIRFRAITDGEDVVFGMLLDKDGDLETIVKLNEPGVAINNIPLSKKSKTLFATMPLKKGKPAWKNVTVELLSNGGMIADLCNAFTNIHEKIQALDARIDKLVSSYETEVKNSLIRVCCE